MFQVEKNFVIYSAVVENEDGRWIDGCSGEDVTDGNLLGKFIGQRTINGNHYTYYRKGDEIYQLRADGAYNWLCAASEASVFGLAN